MRSGRRDAESDALRGIRKGAPAADDLLRQFFDARTDLRADLDDRLMEFALDEIAELRRARCEQLRHVRAELPRLRIDNLEFLLDAYREAGVHRLLRR